MMIEKLVGELEAQQSRLLQLFMDLNEPDCFRQYHSDLSPVGWHLGHCIFTENYWIREVVMQTETIHDDLKSLYIPELSIKTRRGPALPDFEKLHRWSAEMQSQNRQHLLDLYTKNSSHDLLNNHFLIGFLTQHYAQHIETAMYVLNQRALRQDYHFPVDEALAARAYDVEMKTVEKGQYAIGGGGQNTYDNEQPGFRCTLDIFHISATPVSNAHYLKFIEDGGYDNPQLWRPRGWKWLKKNRRSHPEHWRQNQDGSWFSVSSKGAATLKNESAVSGINHYEAGAFAHWAGARLPHEYEWETARKQNLLEQTGECWEWCGNLFHPYDGFKYRPYKGYSMPYFNNGHYTLKGGSPYTQTCVNRSSFRNYYQPHKRHISAGVRLALN